MTRLARLLPLALGAALLFPARIPPRAGLDVQGFARLPVLEAGRVKPMDSAARTALLLIHGRQSLRMDGRRLSAAEWLLDVMARPEAADLYRVFRVEDRDVLGLLGREGKGVQNLSFMELEPYLAGLSAQAARAGRLEAAQRSRFEAAVVNLSDRLDLYRGLKNSLEPEGTKDMPAELEVYRSVVPAGVSAVAAHATGGRFDREALQALGVYFEGWRFLAQAARLRPVPPAEGEPASRWRPVGEALLEEMRGAPPHPAVACLARMAKGWREGDADAFNGALAAHADWLSTRRRGEWLWSRAESLYDRVQPFAKGMTLYLAVFLLFLASWAARPQQLRRLGGDLLGLAFAVHTAGLAARMLLQGRPPVTNLYSSALFVGWVAALLGLVLERREKNGFGGLVASASGFLTLIIAHNLQGQGDTLEVMRAVLDSNFWLSTHVVCVTMGYGAMFLASALAHVWIFRRVAAVPDGADDKRLVSMTYGVVCAALLFSFVGTILGGIWADQSWGRFWGWDPKENGALLIVLWNAIVLHARWGGFARERGLMLMAVFGGIITSLSWFGVNMLGIGLHSYGFMDKAFYALAAFVVAQAAVMAAGRFSSR